MTRPAIDWLQPSRTSTSAQIRPASRFVTTILLPRSYHAIATLPPRRHQLFACVSACRCRGDASVAADCMGLMFPPARVVVDRADSIGSPRCRAGRSWLIPCTCSSTPCSTRTCSVHKLPLRQKLTTKCCRRHGLSTCTDRDVGVRGTCSACVCVCVCVEVSLYLVLLADV